MPAITRLAVLAISCFTLTGAAVASVSPVAPSGVLAGVPAWTVTAPQKAKKPKKPAAPKKATKPKRSSSSNDKAQRERQQREAAKRAERQRQQREAAKRAERQRQQREAAKRAERQRQQREAAKRAERQRQQQEAAKRAERQRQQREAAERAERQRQQREAAERAERQRDAARRAERDRQQRDAALRAQRERDQRDAAVRAAREREQRDAADRARRESDAKQKSERERLARREALAERERMRREADAIRRKTDQTPPPATTSRDLDATRRPLTKSPPRDSTIRITPRPTTPPSSRTGGASDAPIGTTKSPRSLKDGIVVVDPRRRDVAPKGTGLRVTSIVPKGATFDPQPVKPRPGAPRFDAPSGWTPNPPLAEPLPEPEIAWQYDDHDDYDDDCIDYDDLCPSDHYDIHYTHHDLHCSDDWWHYGTHRHGWRWACPPHNSWSFFVHGGSGWSWTIGFSTGWRWSYRPYRAARFVSYGDYCSWRGGYASHHVHWTWHRSRHWRWGSPRYVRRASWSGRDCDWAPYRPWRAWYDTHCAPPVIVVRDTVYRTPEPVLYDPIIPVPTLLDAWQALDDGRDHRALEIFTSLLDDPISDAQARIGYALTQGMLGRTRIAAEQLRRAAETDAREFATLPLTYRLQDRLGELTRVYEERLALHVDELDALFMIAALNVMTDDATVAYFAISAAERRGDGSLALSELKAALEFE